MDPTRVTAFTSQERMESGPAFQVDLDLNLIQSLRLVHALLESKGDLRVPSQDRLKFKKLREIFGVAPSAGESNVPVLPELEIDHEEPRTRVGKIERPLILAQGMIERLRSLWPENRSVRVCFAGRLHQERREVLRAWLHRQRPECKNELPSQSAVDRRVQLRKKVKSYARRVLRGPLRPLRKYVVVPPIERRMTYGSIVFVTSDRGWRHPTKAWDPQYFQLLSNSQFVLCPDGRYVWTYRFFEAVLCGAIPIIQNWCPLYDGFRYYTMDDPLDTLKWSRNDALHNFKMCCDRLTIPHERMNKEVDRLLRNA